MQALFHATTKAALDSILTEGLRVDMADPSAKIKGCWVCTASHRAWAVLHVIRKHHAQLADVVVIEVAAPRSRLTRFKKGLYFSKTDITAACIKRVVEGATFSASASE